MKNKIKGCTHHESKVLKMATGGVVPGPNITKRMTSPVGKRSMQADSTTPVTDTTTNTTQNTATTPTTIPRFDVGKEFERFNRKISNGTLDKQYGFFRKGTDPARAGRSMGFMMFLGDRLGKVTQPKKKDET